MIARFIVKVFSQIHTCGMSKVVVTINLWHMARSNILSVRSTRAANVRQIFSCVTRSQLKLRVW